MTDALRTPCVVLMSHSEWMCNPIFVFNNKSHLNDISNLISIRVELNGILAIPTNIIVLGLYDSYLTFDYNEYAELTSMTPSSAPPLNNFIRKIFILCCNIIHDMVSSIGYLLQKNSRVTGFGVHRKPTTRGCGLRKVTGAVSRPALTYIANKLAYVISGGSRRRRALRKPRTVHGSSWRPSGMGVKKRRPRSALTRKRRITTGSSEDT